MSASLSMRLVLVAVLCCAGLTAAQATWTTCPTTSAILPDLTCAPFKTCLQQRCTCTGDTWNNATSTCTFASSRTCTALTGCQTTFLSCLAAASSATCFDNYRLAVIAVASGTSYINSTLREACVFNTCQYFNRSSASGCTTRDSVYNAVCVLPATTTPTTTIPSTTRPTLSPAAQRYIGSLKIQGNFTAQLADPVKKAALIVAVKADLERILGYAVEVLELLDGSLIVKFRVEGESNDPALVTALASASSSSSWLTSTQAAYTANGGVGTLTVVGITATTTAPVTPTPTATPTSQPASAGRAYATLAALLAAMLILA